VQLAQQHNAKLHVLVVLPEPKIPFGLNISLPDESQIRHTLVQQKSVQWQEIFDDVTENISIDFEVCFGHTYLEGIKYCLRNDIDVVLKQAKSPEWVDFLFDSEDLHLARKCPNPVWLIPQQQPLMYRRIMLAVDFDHIEEASESRTLNLQLLNWAASIAHISKAKLYLLNVCDSAQIGFASMYADNPDEFEREALREERLTRQSLMYDLMDSADSSLALSELKTQVVIAQGDPNHTVAEQVKLKNADLLVMGTLGRSGIPGMLIGNTAESALLQVNCAVLTIKPEGFESPVRLR
jgi:nucleotide-binding universal stress UspA family protein